MSLHFLGDVQGQPEWQGLNDKEAVVADRVFRTCSISKLNVPMQELRDRNEERQELRQSVVNKRSGSALL